MRVPVLTVRDLIALLKDMPQEAPVITEGCDCNGDAKGVELQFDDVVILRKQNADYYDAEGKLERDR